MSIRPVVKPLRTEPQAGYRIRRLNRMKNADIPASATQVGRKPGRCGSPQASIPAPTAVCPDDTAAATCRQRIRAIGRECGRAAFSARPPCARGWARRARYGESRFPRRRAARRDTERLMAVERPTFNARQAGRIVTRSKALRGARDAGGMASEGEAGGGSSPRLGCRVVSSDRRPESQRRALIRRLGTASNHPAVKRRRPGRPWPSSLAAAPDRPAVGLDNIDALDLEGLATALDRPVDKPARPEPQADCRVGRPNRMKKRRHSCFNDRGAAFPSDANLHRRRFPPQWRYRENHSTESTTAPPQAARTLPGGQERITQGSTARQGRKALSSGRQSRENRQLDDERLSISLSECLATAPNHPAAEPISTHKI